MSNITYPSYDDLLGVYEKTVEKSGGGLSGIRDKGGIESVLGFIQNDDYYPDFAAKLTHLVYSLCRGHSFTDGNKRIAITAGAYFLLTNGYYFPARSFMPKMEAIIYHVAAGHIDKTLFGLLIDCIIADVDYDEALKIRLANAMGAGLSDENASTTSA